MRYTKLVIVALFVMVLLGAPSAGSATPRQPNQVIVTSEHGDPNVPDVVAPVTEAEPLSGKLLAAALSQVGVAQDCTDLVQNSLAAIGLTTRRDAGGFDYGVQNVASTFGYEIHWSEARPGDIATVGPNNGGHVWIVLDPSANTGVHGGWGGMNTRVANSGVPLAQHVVYRLYE